MGAWDFVSTTGGLTWRLGEMHSHCHASTRDWTHLVVPNSFPQLILQAGIIKSRYMRKTDTTLHSPHLLASTNIWGWLLGCLMHLQRSNDWCKLQLMTWFSRLCWFIWMTCLYSQRSKTTGDCSDKAEKDGIKSEDWEVSFSPVWGQLFRLYSLNQGHR